MGENLLTDPDDEATALTKEPVDPSGLVVFAQTMGAAGAVAPALAQVPPKVGFGKNAVEPVWLVCVPELVPKFCTEVCACSPILPRQQTANSIHINHSRLLLSLTDCIDPLMEVWVKTFIDLVCNCLKKLLLFRL